MCLIKFSRIPRISLYEKKVYKRVINIMRLGVLFYETPNQHELIYLGKTYVGKFSKSFYLLLNQR